MKRLVISVMLTVLTAVAVQAARALSEPFAAVQPDGTTVVVTLYGDEYVSWLTTSDGMLLVEQAGGYYVASVGDQGQLTATKLLAHEPAQRTSREQQACQEQQARKALFFEQADRTLQAARRAQVTSTNYFPHQGSPKCLVLLVNFSDNQFASDDPVAQFNQYFNGETQENLGHNEQNNFVSVREYFRQCSHGNFTPQFDIVGPFTLPQTLDYYGADSGSSKDVNFNQFCKDAIAAADGTVNFKDYDNTGDNRAELVCVIYAGYGQSVSGNPANTLWPKCSWQGVTTADGVSVSYMNCSPELLRVSHGTNINGIGLFCHEYSHGMGLPDHYATNSSAQINNQTPEFFDLMDYGEYAQNGYAPVPYTAWEQSAMGWIEIEELTESKNGLQLSSLMRDGGKAYKFGNAVNPEEWMILENVQPRDNNGRILGFPYGHGLLVWHIGYTSATVNMGDFPNNTAGKPKVSIVPADGLVINGYQFGDGKTYSQAQYIASLQADPFPGTENKTELTADMGLPNYKFYNNYNDDGDDDTAPVFKLQNIVEDASTSVVTFNFFNGTPTAIRSVSDAQAAGSAAFYDLQGRRTATPASPGIYIQNGKKIVVR